MTCTSPIKRGLWSALLLMALPVTAAEPEPIRIQQLQRCGDLLQTQTQTFCLQVKGLQSGQWQARLNGERLPSGLRKFGAVLGEGVATGCNSVTNPGVVLGCNSTVWPNVTVTGIHGPDSQHR